MAFQSKSGQKFTNASQARAADRRETPIAGKAQGDGKQPVSSFSKPEAPRAPDRNDPNPPSYDSTYDHIAPDGSDYYAPTKSEEQDKAGFDPSLGVSLGQMQRRSSNIADKSLESFLADNQALMHPKLAEALGLPAVKK